MARRKRKKPCPIFLSTGPLPDKIAKSYLDHLLIFSDASRLHHGGLAAIFYETPETEPTIATKSVPMAGSNELELLAVIFALQQKERHFPNRLSALFSDNQDAVKRLNNTQEKGCPSDPDLEKMFTEHGINQPLRNTTVHWIKGHATCRGNNLADIQARIAATQWITR